MIQHTGIAAVACVLLTLAACSGSGKEQSYTVESAAGDVYDPKVYNTFYDQSYEFSHDILNGNFINVLKHYNPEEMELYGGRDSIMKGLVLAYNYVKDDPKEIKIFMPEQLYRIEGVIAGIAKSETVMTHDGRIIKSVEWLLGVSKDEGKFWYFSTAHRDKIKLLLPHFNNEFEIPEAREPIPLN